MVRQRQGPAAPPAEDLGRTDMARELIEELESKRLKSEADKIALAVAKVLVPDLTNAI